MVRTAGDDHEPRVFSTWAPKVVALIGELPDTLADRSITIPMRRRNPTETVERLRLDRLGELEPLRRMAWRWARDHENELREADPSVPPGLHDRAADNWRSLLAIADLAGGEWPNRARETALALAGGADDDDGSVRTLLLRDLKEIFEKRGTDRLSSQDIVATLERMEERPWPEWGRSRKPLSKTGLAKLLKPFGVRPKTVKMPDGSTPRGYRRDELDESWSRYLPEGNSQPQPPQPFNDGTENSGFPNRNLGQEVALRESPETPCSATKVAGVALAEVGSAEVEELSDEDLQYCDDERTGMQMENPDLELAPTDTSLFEGLAE